MAILRTLALASYSRNLSSLRPVFQYYIVIIATQPFYAFGHSTELFCCHFLSWATFYYRQPDYKHERRVDEESAQYGRELMKSSILELRYVIGILMY